MHVLLLDNYDSFTYNLYDYLLQLGVECTVVRNDALSAQEIASIPFDALVVSPGPRRPENAGCLMDLLAIVHTQKPILGICLGHQALGQLLGLPLAHARVPVHGKTSRIRHSGHPIFAGLPPDFEVMRYHSLILPDPINHPFYGIAYTDDGELMAMAHRSLPLLGLQFHPESILTEYGLGLLRNWIDRGGELGIRN